MGGDGRRAASSGGCSGREDGRRRRWAAATRRRAAKSKSWQRWLQWKRPCFYKWSHLRVIAYLGTNSMVMQALRFCPHKGFARTLVLFSRARKRRKTLGLRCSRGASGCVFTPRCARHPLPTSTPVFPQARRHAAEWFFPCTIDTVLRCEHELLLNEQQCLSAVVLAGLTSSQRTGTFTCGVGLASSATVRLFPRGGQPTRLCVPFLPGSGTRHGTDGS